MASLSDFLRTLSDSGNDPGKMNLNVGVARKELPGQTTPSLSGLAPEELSQYDRFSHAASAQQGLGPVSRGLNVLGIPLVAGANELSKAIPGGQNLLAGLTGDTSFNPDSTTSPASLANVIASAKGGLYGAFNPRTR